MRKVITVSVVVLIGLLSQAKGADSVPLAQYLEFARKAADWTWEHYDSLETVWQNKIDPENVFGYRPPPRFL